MQPSTSKGHKEVRYDCQHIKEVRQVKFCLDQLKKDYGDILVKTTNLIHKITELEQKVNTLEAANIKT